LQEKSILNQFKSVKIIHLHLLTRIAEVHDISTLPSNGC